ncbi:MAG: NUDIX domain-containing protein [Nanoarchaeota archaeon]|nr:NUDIX domain-containing protein [Nanoarchaeota archaeon]
MERIHPQIVHINENGESLGPISYEEAHPLDPAQEGMRHAVANLLIFNDSSYSELLLSKRSHIVRSPEKWDCSAGGHVDWIGEKGIAEPPLEAALRELNEELFQERGIPPELKIEGLGKFWKHVRANNHELIYLFRGIYSGPFYHSSEISTLTFFPVINLKHRMESERDKFTVNLFYCFNKHLEIMSAK